jgi:bifunctional non-homologous end joining protein LigD
MSITDYNNNRRIKNVDISVKSGKTLKELTLEKEKNIKIPKKISVLIQRLPNEEMPQFLKPMHATLIDKPFNKKGWIFELKWDGYRALSYIKDSKAKIVSRNNLNFNERFNPLADALTGYYFQAIFDGEIIAVDEHGNSNFQDLQNYQRTREGNLIYYIFDILHLNGKNLRNLPLRTRKEILAEILPKKQDLIRYADHIEEKGKEFFKLIQQKEIEGIIAKKENSVYEPGKRGNNWQKIKALHRQEAVIAGMTAPKGGRKGFGSLVLGVYEGEDLVYIGQSGGGFDEKELLHLANKFRPHIITKSPFKKPPKLATPATWLEPKIVCEVKFTKWTDDGKMRHPVYLGLRDDKDPRKVKKETAKKI